MNVRGTRKIRWLVGDVACEWMGVMSASKRLAQWCGLDHPLVGELLVRWRDDAEARRRASFPTQAGSLGREMSHIVLVPVIGTVAFG